MKKSLCEIFRLMPLEPSSAQIGINRIPIDTAQTFECPLRLRLVGLARCEDLAPKSLLEANVKCRRSGSGSPQFHCFFGCAGIVNTKRDVCKLRRVRLRKNIPCESPADVTVSVRARPLAAEISRSGPW